MAEGSEPDIVYMPILKGRAGELRALGEVSDTTAAKLTPLVEIPLIADESDSDDPDGNEITGDLGKFAENIQRRWSPKRRIILDVGNMPARQNSIPSVDLIYRLAQNDFTITPTVRPSDEEWITRAVGESISEWGLKSACIRLGGDDLDDNDGPLDAAISRVLDWLNLEADDVDLVLDFRTVMDESAVSFIARIARLVLGELPYEDKWRTLVVASGAFPPDLNSIQSEVLTEVPRYDAAMWSAVKARVRGRVPIFGDYAIAYPAQAAGVPFAPAPQLRFTSETNWLVMKGRRQDRRGAKQFYDICARIAEAGPVEPTLSWGDRYVHEAAQSAKTGRDLIKTGNAMIWRAVGTSHHLAYVANRLATVGVP
jgi:hypothetical protein